MSEYISFGRVIQNVDGIDYDVSEDYEVAKKGTIHKLEDRVKELERKLAFICKVDTEELIRKIEAQGVKYFHFEGEDLFMLRAPKNKDCSIKFHPAGMDIPNEASEDEL